MENTMPHQSATNNSGPGKLNADNLHALGASPSRISDQYRANSISPASTQDSGVVMQPITTMSQLENIASIEELQETYTQEHIIKIIEAIQQEGYQLQTSELRENSKVRNLPNIVKSYGTWAGTHIKIQDPQFDTLARSQAITKTLLRKIKYTSESITHITFKILDKKSELLRMHHEALCNNILDLYTRLNRSLTLFLSYSANKTTQNIALFGKKRLEDITAEYTYSTNPSTDSRPEASSQIISSVYINISGKKLSLKELLTSTINTANSLATVRESLKAVQKDFKDLKNSDSWKKTANDAGTEVSFRTSNV